MIQHHFVLMFDCPWHVDVVIFSDSWWMLKLCGGGCCGSYLYDYYY